MEERRDKLCSEAEYTDFRASRTRIHPIGPETSSRVKVLNMTNCLGIAREFIPSLRILVCIHKTSSFEFVRLSLFSSRNLNCVAVQSNSLSFGNAPRV